MATVPRSYIDGYADALEDLSDKMKESLKRALEDLDWDRPVAEVREDLVALMQAYCGASTDVASNLAAEFYGGLRERMVGDAGDFEPLVTGGAYDDDAVEGFVRAAVQPLAEGDDMDVAAELVMNALVERIGYEIKSAAGHTVFHNGRKDTERVRYARIPRGSKSYPGGCPFCRMLASRGFKYASELSAGGTDPNHYHDGCQCMVVPGFGDNPKVEGYNPRDYDDGYQDWLDRDHSQHEQRVRETQRNRYDSQGRLKSGTGQRIDEKETLTDADRARIRSERTAKGNETRRRAREERRLTVGGTTLPESEWRAMSEAEQRALLRTRGDQGPVTRLLRSAWNDITDTSLHLVAPLESWSDETKDAFRGLVDSLKAFASNRYVPMFSSRGIPSVGIWTSRGEYALTNNAVHHIWADHPTDGRRQRLTISDVVDALENPIRSPEVMYREDGKLSERHYGMNAVVVVNPDTMEVITAWDTRPSDFKVPKRGRR